MQGAKGRTLGRWCRCNRCREMVRRCPLLTTSTVIGLVRCGLSLRPCPLFSLRPCPLFSLSTSSSFLSHSLPLSLDIPAPNTETPHSFCLSRCPRLHYRLLTLCPPALTNPTDPESWPPRMGKTPRGHIHHPPPLTLRAHDLGRRAAALEGRRSLCSLGGAWEFMFHRRVARRVGSKHTPRARTHTHTQERARQTARKARQRRVPLQAV